MQSGIQTALTLGLVLVFGACKHPNQPDPAGAHRAEAVPTGRPGASSSATPAAEVVPATDRGCGMAGFCWMRPAVGAANIPSVWSSSADNAWAVDASGRILHYDGRSWSVALRPVTSGLSRVWGTSARDVWAVGASGVALHFDGQQWFQVSTGISFDLHALWGVGTTEVWAGGEGGLLRWDGRAWSMVDSPAPSRVTALWSPDAQTLWAVNEMGEVHRRHNGVWGRMTPPEANAFVAIAGRSDRDVWIAGSREGMGTRVYHWDGQAWQTTTVEAVVDGPRWDIPIVALAARGEGVWAGGMFTLQRWHTGQWQSDEGAELALTMRVFVRSVEALWAGEDHLWAAGQEGLRGMLLLKRGAAWQETTGLREGGANAGWAVASNDVWIAGQYGEAMHWDGARWASYAVLEGSREHWEAVWASSARDVWMVGAGRVARWDGSAWRHMPTPANTSGFSAVWGTGPDNVWVAGAQGTLLRWNGQAWTRLNTSTTESFSRLWAASADDLWVVGSEGTVLRWRGGRPVRVTLPNAPERIHSLWGRAADDVWIAADHRLYHFDGTGWTHTYNSDQEQLWSGPDGVLWSLSWGGKVTRLEGTRWVEVAQLPEGSGFFTRGFASPEGDHWLLGWGQSSGNGVRLLRRPAAGRRPTP